MSAPTPQSNFKYRELDLIKGSASVYHGAVKIGTTRASIGG